MYEIKRIQHPVGQGCFHSFEISNKDQKFTYIYDCGSDNLTELHREIDVYTELYGNDKIDLLVLSHLDNDHVNGVERLLANIDVETVMLPYLHFWERLYLFSDACHNKSLTTGYFDLVADPVTWFQSRGAKRVVFVSSSMGGDEPTNPDALSPLGPDFNGDNDSDHHFFLKMRSYKDGNYNRPDIKSSSEVSISFLPRSEEISIATNRGPLWVIVPFNHPEPVNFERFIKELKRLLRIRVLGKRNYFSVTKRIKKILSNKHLRKELADLYFLIRKDRNLSSMSIYSGPARNDGRVYHRCRGIKFEEQDELFEFSQRRWFRRKLRHRKYQYFHEEMVRSGGKGGWLGTGDSNFNSRNRLQAFSDFYRRHIGYVSTFLLPHHGSKNNFNGSSLKTQLDEVLGIAAASSSNTYGHPDPILMHTLNYRGVALCVNEDTRSSFYEELFYEV